MEGRYDVMTGNDNSAASDDIPDYGDPLPGESLSDYIKREDPELYGYLEGRYDAMTGDY